MHGLGESILLRFLLFFYGYMFLPTSDSYVLECAKCGVIYRSRQYWYGNQDPINTVVRTEIRHVWPGVSRSFPVPCTCTVSSHYDEL